MFFFLVTLAKMIDEMSGERNDRKKRSFFTVNFHEIFFSLFRIIILNE